MRALRRLEAVSGTLAVVVGGAGLIDLAAFPPVLRVTKCGALGAVQPGACPAFSIGLLPAAGSGAVVLYGSVAILLLGVGAAAFWHSRTQERRARTVLWGTTTLPAIVSLALSLFAGPQLLLSTGFAVVACACSFGRQRTLAT